MDIELIDGFSPRNALACVQASADAYTEDPTVQTPLAHAIIREAGGVVVVAFRGTQHAIDWLTDLYAWYSSATHLRWADGPGRGRVHHGFASAFESIAGLLSSELDAYRAWPIILTGHSLGAAIAQLFAGCVGARLHSCYTFGSPRVGDGLWAEYYDATQISGGALLGLRTYHIINQLDIIPRFPGLLCGYRRTGIEVLLTPSWSYWVSPPWWLRLYADMRAVVSDVRTRKIGLLADHHVGIYNLRLTGQSARPSQQSTNPSIHPSPHSP
jgi:predicted lipase